MRPVTIRYAADVDAFRRFYEALGLAVTFASRENRQGVVVWTEFASQGVLAVHAADAASGGGSGTELAFEADEALEAVVERLTTAGFVPGPIVDESFGRSLRVADPDGVAVQINETEHALQS